MNAGVRAATGNEGGGRRILSDNVNGYQPKEMNEGGEDHEVEVNVVNNIDNVFVAPNDRPPCKKAWDCKCPTYCPPFCIEGKCHCVC